MALKKVLVLGSDGNMQQKQVGDSTSADVFATPRTIESVSFDGSANIRVNNLINIHYALGGTVKAESYPGSVYSSTAGALADGIVKFVACWLPNPDTITGIAWEQVVAGSYTADAYNGVGLYTYLAGTLTLVASSTNDGNIWKGTASTWNKKSFSSPYIASGGLYFIAFLYNNSAQTTAPTTKVYPTNPLTVTYDFTNSAKLCGTLLAQASLPASIPMSSIVGSITIFHAQLY